MASAFVNESFFKETINYQIILIMKCLITISICLTALFGAPVSGFAHTMCYDSISVVDTLDASCMDSVEVLPAIEKEEVKATPLVNKSYSTAYTITDVNLREGPGTGHKILGKIAKLKPVMVETAELKKAYAKVMDIETGREGYVSTKYLDHITKVKVNGSGFFTPIGRTYSKYAQVTLKNDSYVTANIKFGNKTYKVAPHSSKTLEQVEAGTYNIVVSSPGIFPYVGVEKVVGGMRYAREFYITTSLGKARK